MLPISHLAPINSKPLRPSQNEALLLADAFSEFIAASSKLENSYRELQVEVAQLGSELATRNAELEASLRHNEQMRLALVEVVDSMPCGVLVLGDGAKVLRINPEAKRILALSGKRDSPESLGQMAAWTAVDLRPFCAIEGENEFSFVPRDHVVSDKAVSSGKETRRWIELRTRRLSGEASEAQTILILSDVSAHKQAEQDREAGRRALALAEIAATLAHEIRNPLASLELFVGLLEEEPARSMDWTAHLRAGVRSLAATVNNVLSFHGASSPHLRPFVLSDTVQAAVEFVRPIAEQAGLNISFQGAGLRGEVMANEAALQQVILNLVANAVRHTEAGGSIVILLKQSGAAHLLLAITDTGCGIAAEHLPKIFQPGWSASGTSTGLGLAVCQRIAAQHGAVLRVASEPGRGTSFEMELPTL